MADEKRTKVDYFEELRSIVATNVADQEKQDEFLAFIDNELETIYKRREAQRKRAEQKRAESDELTDRIYELVDDEYASLTTIMERLNDENISKNKVSARLGKLIKAGKVEKDSIKAEDGGRRMAYRRIAA